MRNLRLAVTESLLAGDSATAASLLEQLAAEPDASFLLPFISALQAIVVGSRDRTLSDAPDLDYGMRRNSLPDRNPGKATLALARLLLGGMEQFEN